MIRYVVRVTPWLMLTVSCGVIAGLMALVAAWPWIMWPLEGTSVGVIVGVVAMAMDERCASIVDTLPRGLAWRTAGRAAVVAPALLVVWVGCLLAWEHRLPDHLGLFALQGAGGVAVALAYAVQRRSAGTAEPGAAFAAIVIPTTTALALIRPRSEWLPLFPLLPADNWSLSRTIWVTATLAAPVLALSLRRRALRDIRRRAIETFGGGPFAAR